MPLRKLLAPASLLLATMALAQGNGAFLENRGQWPATVHFKADLPGAAVWCESDGLLIDRYVHRRDPAETGPHPRPFRTDHHVLRLRMVGADANARWEGLCVQRGAYNFFLGDDASRWASGAHAFDAFIQRSVWPGVDVRWRRTGDALKYDLLLAPGADVQSIAFRYEAADKVALRGDDLVIGTSLGEMVERIPLAYQEVNGVRIPVMCSYRLKNGVVRFVIGEHDSTRAIVIDPTLELSTYSGSASDNFGYSATYDSKGFLYAGSSSFGNGYPTSTGAYQQTWHGGDGQLTIPGTDIALTKFDTTGSFLIWSTMLGGSGDDLPHSLIVDQNDELIVLGTTGSPDFPTTSEGYDQTFGGGVPYTPQGIGVSYPNGADMIVARISNNGQSLLASTFLGGSLNDGHNSAAALKVNYADEMRGEILLAPNNDVVIVSCTTSPDFPTTAGAPQTLFGGGSHDGVVCRFDPSLSSLLWSTFFGGGGSDAAFSGEYDESGRLFICGGTNSTNLPTTSNAFQTTYQGGTADAFVAKYNALGSQLTNCTYYGSAAYDQSYLMDLDQEGNPFLFGQTLAPVGEMLENAAYSDLSGGQFICKMDPLLTDRLIGARIGDFNNVVDLDISPTAFLVDYCDKLYVCGWGSPIYVQLSTTGLPITNNAYQSTTDGQDFYLAVFEVDMSALSYGTYFGGNLSEEHVDGGTSRFDRRGRVYGAVCAGCGNHDDFPHTPGAWSSTNNSNNCNLAVFKFDFDAPLVIADPAAQGPICAGDPIQFQNHSQLGQTYLWDFGDNSQGSTTVAPFHTYAQPGTYTVTLTAFNPNACNEQDVDSIQVHVSPAAPFLQAMDDVNLCGPTSSITLSATSNGTATTFIWSTNAGFTDTLNTSMADSTAVLSPPVQGVYVVQASTPGSCIAIDAVMITTSLINAAISPDVSICADETATLTLTGIDAGSTITWAPAEDIDAGQGTTTVQMSPSESETFTATVISPSGCSWSASANVNVSPLFGSSVGASVDEALVLPGTTVHLNATPSTGVTYQWTPAAAVSNASIANPSAFVTNTTWFGVTITDGTCTRKDSVLVTVYELRCEEPDIFVPDAFTPNSDGNNDLLFVRGRHIATLDFKVFDRWGELVFETTDQTKGWDATFRGKAVDPAVFVFWLDATCIDGQHFFKKGNVTVIR